MVEDRLWGKMYNISVILYNQHDILDLRLVLEARRPDIGHLCQITALFSKTQKGGFTVQHICVIFNPLILSVVYKSELVQKIGAFYSSVQFFMSVK